MTTSDPQAGPVVLWKVGGSMLALPDFADRLARAIDGASPARTLLLVGGGEAADLVRTWDRRFRLDDATAHRLALRAMRLSAELVAAVLPRARVAWTRAEVEPAWSAGRLPVLDPVAFLDEADAREGLHGEPLPCSWDVTSDSIAARVAARWPAALVLVKSTDPPPPDTPGDAVDPYFRTAAAGVPHVAWLNLRRERPMPVEWS